MRVRCGGGAGRGGRTTFSVRPFQMSSPMVLYCFVVDAMADPPREIAAAAARIGSTGTARMSVTAAVRAVVQLSVVAAIIVFVVQRWWATVAFVLVMLAAATVTSARRMTRRRSGLLAGVAIAAGTAPVLAAVLAATVVTVVVVVVVVVGHQVDRVVAEMMTGRTRRAMIGAVRKASGIGMNAVYAGTRHSRMSESARRVHEGMHY